jgi:hypothetical protein
MVTCSDERFERVSHKNSALILCHNHIIAKNSSRGQESAVRHMTREVPAVVLPPSSSGHSGFGYATRKCEDFAQDSETFLKKYVGTIRIRLKAEK